MQGLCLSEGARKKAGKPQLNRLFLNLSPQMVKKNIELFELHS